MDEIYQCYVVVDENGMINSVQQGKNLVVTDDYDFGFIVKELIDIDEWKVVINKMKPELVLKSAE